MQNSFLSNNHNIYIFTPSTSMSTVYIYKMLDFKLRPMIRPTGFFTKVSQLNKVIKRNDDKRVYPRIRDQTMVKTYNLRD